MKMKEEKRFLCSLCYHLFFFLFIRTSKVEKRKKKERTMEKEGSVS